MMEFYIYDYSIPMKKNQRITDRIRYLVMLKSNVSDVYSHKHMKMKINSDNNLTLEGTLKIQNVVTLTELVFNKNYNHYYYQVF